MLDLFVEIEAFAGNFTRRIDDHCTDQRTGTNLSGAVRRQLERASHHLAIRFSPFVQSVLPSGNEVSTTCVSGLVQESTHSLSLSFCPAAERRNVYSTKSTKGQSVRRSAISVAPTAGTTENEKEAVRAMNISCLRHDATVLIARQTDGGDSIRS